MIELIMCTYNGVGYIEKQLDSIRCQTRQLDKVSIFDDISTDNTVEIIKKYINKYGLSEKWSLNVNAENKGWRRNFYDAIFASTGDIVFFCDQDDIWLLDKVEVMTKCFENNSKMLKLNSFYTLIDQDDKLVENDNVYNALPCNNTKIIKKENFKDNFGYRWLKRLGCTSAISASFRNLIKNLPFHPLFSHDFVLENIAAALGESYVIDYVSIKYRIHSSNNSKNDNSYHENTEYAKYVFLCFKDYVKNIDNKYVKYAKGYVKFAKLREKIHSKFAPFSWLLLLFYSTYYYNGLRGHIGDLIDMLHLRNWLQAKRNKKIK